MTNAASVWVALPIQMVFCGAVLFIDGAFLFGNVYDGLETGIEVAVLAAATTVGALIVGLPLRLIPPLRRWWVGHATYTLMAVVLAVVVAVLAWIVGDAGLRHFRAFDGQPAFDAWSPDPRGAVVAWFLLALTTAHAWPPARWRGPGRSSG